MSKWASDDDANDLLAGILNETAEDAAAEEAKVQAEIQAKREQKEARARAERDRKLADAESRISAEQKRQSKLEERRTAKMEALRVEELKAKGEWVDPAELARKQAEAEAQRKADEARLAASMAQLPAETAQPQYAPAAIAPPAANSNRLVIALAVAIAGVLAVAGITVAIAQNGYEMDQASYAKSVYAPKDANIAVVEAGFSVPKAAPAASEPTAVASRPKTKRAGRTKPKVKKPKRDNVSDEAAKRAAALQEALGGSEDIFGTSKK